MTTKLQNNLSNFVELYTMEYAVEPLLQYIPKDKVIWAPCDKEWSAFVKVFTDNGYKVIHSHIDEGKDLFTYEPEEHWDILITNPPFSNKGKIMKRFLSFNKPLAVLLPTGAINEQTIPKLFHESGKQLQLLVPIERMGFIYEKMKVGKQPAFKCIYICYNLLPKDLIICKLNSEVNNG